MIYILCIGDGCELTLTVVTVELMDAPSLTCTSYTGFSNTGPLVLGPGTTVTSTIVWEYFPPVSVACKDITIVLHIIWKISSVL
jgi:hypothetical protein